MNKQNALERVVESAWMSIRKRGELIPWDPMVESQASVRTGPAVRSYRKAGFLTWCEGI